MRGPEEQLRARVQTSEAELWEAGWASAFWAQSRPEFTHRRRRVRLLRLAWSLFSTIVARGAEVEFGKNAVIDIGFNQRTVDDTTKLKGDGAAAAAR